MWLCGCSVSALRNIQVVNGCSQRSVVVGKRAPIHGCSSASRSTLRAHHNIIQQHVSRFSIQESGEAISTQFPDLSPSFSGSNPTSPWRLPGAAGGPWPRWPRWAVASACGASPRATPTASWDSTAAPQRRRWRNASGRWRSHLVEFWVRIVGWKLYDVWIYIYMIYVYMHKDKIWYIYIWSIDMIYIYIYIYTHDIYIYIIDKYVYWTCIMIYYDILWYLMISYDILWYIMIYYDLLWSIMIYYSNFGMTHDPTPCIDACT